MPAPIGTVPLGMGDVPATHERALIRQYVVQLLSTQFGAPPDYPTACGPNVFSSRVEPLIQKKAFPCIGVYTADEQVDTRPGESEVWPDPDNPGYLKRLLKLTILILVAQDTGFDDVVDAIGLQVETLLDNAHILDGTATMTERGIATSWSRLVESQILAESHMDAYTAGEKTIGALRLIYEVTYRTPTRCPASVADPNYTTILASWVPKIGIPYKPDYVPITNVPPLTGIPQV